MKFKRTERIGAIVKILSDNPNKIYIGQKKENIVDGLDIVVYTAAIHPDNEELITAKNHLPFIYFYIKNNFCGIIK